MRLRVAVALGLVVVLVALVHATPQDTGDSGSEGGSSGGSGGGLWNRLKGIFSSNSDSDSENPGFFTRLYRGLFGNSDSNGENSGGFFNTLRNLFRSDPNDPEGRPNILRRFFNFIGVEQDGTGSTTAAQLTGLSDEDGSVLLNSFAEEVENGFAALCANQECKECMMNLDINKLLEHNEFRACLIQNEECLPDCMERCKSQAPEVVTCLSL